MPLQKQWGGGVGVEVLEWTLIKSAQKVNSGEENSPAAPARYKTRNLLITSPMLYLLSYPNLKKSKLSWHPSK